VNAVKLLRKQHRLRRRDWAAGAHVFVNAHNILVSCVPASPVTQAYRPDWQDIDADNWEIYRA